MTNTKLPSLDEYPRLAQLLDHDFRADYARKHRSAPDRLYSIVCDPDPRCDPWREDLESLLAVGTDVGLLDQETIGNLRSGHDPQFLGAVSELEAAKFLHERAFPLLPRPEGRPGTHGDLQLALAPQVFVEIKAVLDRPPDILQERLSSKLRNCARRIKLKFRADLEIATVAPDFSGACFRGWLEALLNSVPEAEGASGVYEDRSGFQVAVKAQPHSAPASHVLCTQMRFSWGAETAGYVKASIKIAYQQLPDDGRPTMVVLRPWLTWSLDEDDMLNALYGAEQIVLDTVTGETRTQRANDGFFRRTRPDRLSAVAVLTYRGTPNSRVLDVYHYHLARYPLDWELLRGPQIRHLVRTGKHSFGWKE